MRLYFTFAGFASFGKSYEFKFAQRFRDWEGEKVLVCDAA